MLPCSLENDSMLIIEQVEHVLPENYIKTFSFTNIFKQDLIIQETYKTNKLVVNSPNDKVGTDQLELVFMSF